MKCPVCKHELYKGQVTAHCNNVDCKLYGAEADYFVWAHFKAVQAKLERAMDLIEAYIEDTDNERAMAADLYWLMKYQSKKTRADIESIEPTLTERE